MGTLFSLYQWTLAGGIVAAVALSLLGAHLAARDRAMQTLCVGQGAMVGVLLALGFAGEAEVAASHLIPFFAALIASSATFLFTDRLVAKQTASRNTSFAYTFAFLLASGYLIGSLFPALESHLAQIYFGDLATLTVFESLATLVTSLVFLVALISFWRPLSRQSFECAIFGDSVATRKAPYQMVAFKALTLVMLCISVQFLGFLFTISLLFLPTGILALSQRKGLGIHLILCGVLSGISALAGFSLSLLQTRLPTVPTIVVMLTATCVGWLGADRIIMAFKTRAMAKSNAQIISATDGL